MSVWPSFDEPEAKPSGQPSLVVVTLALAGFGAFLYLVAGLPHLPSHWPSGTGLLTVLRGNDLPVGAFRYVLVTIAWTFWGWAAGSLFVELILAVAVSLSHGAEWATKLRTLAGQVTMPIARRAAEGAVVAAVVVNVIGRSPGAAAAAPLSTPPVHQVVSPTPRPKMPREKTAQHAAEHLTQTTTYTVHAGDNLWAISERFYGTGEEYKRIVDANVGKRMTDGRIFPREAVIQPDWVLTIPLSSHAASMQDGQTWYVVQSGDTMRGIAARFLGDEMRWPEIFQANEGKAKLVDGRTLTDPDLIWPGLRLRIPQPAASAPAVPAAKAARRAPTVTVPALVPVAPTATPSAVAPPASTSLVPVVPTPIHHDSATRRPSSQPSSSPPSTGAAPWIWPTVFGGIGLGATVASAAVLARRHRLRGREDDGAAPLPPRGFVESDVARLFAHRLASGEPEPVLRLVSHVLRILTERDIQGLTLLAATSGRHRLTVLVQAGLVARDQLLDSAADVGRCLGGTGLASLTQDQDVLLEIVDLSPLSLVAAAGESPDDVVLVPIGAIRSAGELDTVYLSWRAVSHILIVGAHGDATSVVLTSLLGALACRLAPDTLRLWTVSRPGMALSQLPVLPHQHGTATDPSDRSRLMAVLEMFRDELERRLRRPAGDNSPSVARDPDWVLVIGELTDLPPDDDQELWAPLDLLSRQGVACGMHLIGVSSQPLGTDGLLLDQFRTRLVMWLAHDEESTLVLGDTNAPDLGRSELFARVEGRRGVLLRGFKISEENLDRLAKLMQQAYGTPLAGPVPPPTTGAPPVNVEMPAEAERAVEKRRVGLAGVDSRVPHAGGSTEDGPPTAVVGGVVSETASDDVVRDGELPLGWPINDPPPIIAINGSGHANGRHESADGIAAPQPPCPVDEQPKPNQHSVGQHDRITTETALASPGLVEVEVASDRHCRPSDGLVERSEPAKAREPVLRIRCFGAFEVVSGNQILEPVTGKGPKYQAWELLALLAAQPTGRISRDGIFSALWSEGDEQQLAHRLRGTLYYLREILSWQIPGCPSQVASHDRGGIWKLDAALVWSDVQEFLRLGRIDGKWSPDEAKERYTRARALYRGNLLSEAPYRWIDERSEQGASLREHYRAVYDRITRRLAEIHEKSQELDQAVPLYEELIMSDPTEEKLVRRLYRCYQRLGDRGALIRAHHHWKEALAKAFCDPEDPEDDSVAYEPSPETTSLYEQIIAGLNSRNQSPTLGQFQR